MQEELADVLLYLVRLDVKQVAATSIGIIGLTATLFTVFGTAISGRDLILIGGGAFLIYKATREIHERLDKVRALAVFASDPISSNAYATEAIMSILIILGSSALALTLPLAMGVATLVLMVVFSYIQTILHYPAGGGSYIVAKDNLGTLPSLIAAAALLTDYILTVTDAAGCIAYDTVRVTVLDPPMPQAGAGRPAATNWNAPSRGPRQTSTAAPLPSLLYPTRPHGIESHCS